MSAGRLRHRVIIQNYTTTTNQYGEETKVWADLDTVWAAVEPLRGTELFESQQRFGALDTRIVMRYLSGVDETMRVKFGSRMFAIVSPPINKDERGIYLELMCKEGLQDAV